MGVKVTCLYKLSESIQAFKPTHIISLLDPDFERAQIPTFQNVSFIQKLFYDRETRDGPSLEIIQEILTFIHHINSQKPYRLLVHCHLGASRSTVFAYIAICLLHPELSPAHAFQKLLAITNKPWPNRRIVELADAFLGKEETLLVPLDRYRAQNPSRYSAYQRLNPIRLPNVFKKKILH